jgi:hypothetical protein
MSKLPDDRRAGLDPPRFSLSTLLYAVALTAVLCALVSYFGLHSALVLILFALAVVAHVAGNALGTQLRANGDKPLPGENGKLAMRSVRRSPTADDFAPPTELRDRRSLGRPIVIATISGGVIVAVLGGILQLTVLDRTPTATALVGGIIACGTLGAFWTFVAFGFVQVAWSAMCQATEKVDPHRKTPNPG